MTETQAKSGAAGASTDAEDTSVETSASPDDGGTKASAVSITDAVESPTTVVRLTPSSDADDEPSSSKSGEDAKPSGFTWPAATSASSAPATSPGSSTGGSARSSYTPTPTPTSTPTVTPTPVASTVAPTPVPAKVDTRADSKDEPKPKVDDLAAKLDDGKAEPTARMPGPVSSVTVPVVGVPATGAGSGGGIGSTGSTAGSASSRSGSAAMAASRTATPGKPAPTPSGAKGAATVPGSTGLSPVIARASVGAPPTPSGLRGTTGAQPVVTPGRGGTSAVGAARVTEAVRSARATVAGAATRGPRRARLHLKRIDPWSVMKFAFAVSLVLFVVAIVATSVLYLALDAMGVFDSINKALGDVTGSSGDAATGGFKITAKGVIGTSVLLGAVNMVLFTALMTLGAFVYNVCADLVGGVELTLSEKD